MIGQARRHRWGSALVAVLIDWFGEKTTERAMRADPVVFEEHQTEQAFHVVTVLAKACVLRVKQANRSRKVPLRRSR